MKQVKNFNIYLRGPEDTVTCPECGARTEFEELPDSAVVSADGVSNEPQLHTCLNTQGYWGVCGLSFISEVDLDDEDLQGSELS